MAVSNGKELKKIQNIHDAKVAVFFKKSILRSILKILTMEHPGFRTMKAVKNIHRLFVNLDLSKYQNSPELLSYIWCITYISKEWIDGMVDINLIHEKAKREKDFDNIKAEILTSCIADAEPITAPEVKMIFNLIAEALQFGYVASMREEYLSLLEDINLDNPAAFKELVQRLFMLSESVLDIKYNTNLVANKITFNTTDIDSVKESISQTISSLSKSNNILKVGIRRLNTLLSPGYMNGRLYVYLGLPGAGKAVPVDTLIPTPGGLKQIKDIEVGNYVFNLYGKPVKVIGVYPQGYQDTYRISFSDGRSTCCNADHLWYTLQLNENGEYVSVVRKLSDMFDYKTTTSEEVKYKYIIPNNCCAEYNKRIPVELDPWTLGYILANIKNYQKPFEIVSSDSFGPNKLASVLAYEAVLIDKVSNTWVFKDGLGEIASTASIIGRLPKMYQKSTFERRIPKSYMFNTEEVRINILKGIFDACGYISKYTLNGKDIVKTGCSLLSKNLVKDIRFVLASLGMASPINAVDPNRIDFNIPNRRLLEFFSKPDKLQMATEVSNFPDDHNHSHVYVTNIEKLTERTKQLCIRVDDPLHVFLTEDFIPTHNSLLLLKTALDMRKYNPDFQPKTPGMKPCVLYITMENSFTETIERVWNLTFDDSITNYSEEEATEKILKELGNSSDEDGPSIEIVIKYFSYREISTDDLFMIIQDLREDNLEVCALVFDYILRIRPSVPIADNVMIELDRIMNELKALAVMKDIPIVTAHQMNRAAAAIVDNAARVNKGDSTKLVGREHVANAWSVIQTCDFAAVLNMEYKPGTDERFMVINVVKRRRVDSNESEFAKYTYLAHPFAKKGIRLIDDMHLDKILSVQSLATDIDVTGTEKTNAAPRLKIMTSSEFDEDLDDDI